MKIDNTVEKTQETEAFLSIKDHKEGFTHTVSFCLINPSKSDIGKISKSLLDTMKENILKQTNVNQWKNTSQIISWFKNIKSKKTSSFVNFDVENFYPSISIDLFTDAISYAKTITNIDDDQLSIIMQSRNLFYLTTMNHGLKNLGKKTLTFRCVVTMACNDL